ncbi:hypothetical protein HOLleu_04575 [Holothuria leucospilota]|uniref:Uncharacterized protein n=1 Tax=Holothuria leucospilota TaxID=206669 RepID=A0A9Q1CUL8_HOLLE|nr:hypothetical protein HOLleu_04575 [Holothuria leucospilota]
MGNEVPREHNGATCWKCGCGLSPASSFEDVEKRTYRGVRYFVFNDGEYYRLDKPYAMNRHECRSCFEKAGRKHGTQK